MPGRYRCILIAAFGLLSLANAAQHEDKQRHEGQAHAAADKQKATPPTIPQLADAPDTKPAEAKCIDEDHKESDCARASAQATIDQASYAYWQAVAGGFGVVIGLGTLVAAAIAAYWAAAAAKHTETGAKAAVGTLHSSRAWLMMSKPVVHDLHNGRGIRTGIRFMIRWINYGQSPALDCGVFIDAKLADGDVNDIPHFHNRVENDRAMVGPNAYIFTSHFDVSAEDIEKIVRLEKTLFVYARAQYRDIYEQSIRVTEFAGRVQIFGDKREPDGNVVPNLTLSPLGVQNSAS